MSETRIDLTGERLSATMVEVLERACDRFEDAWLTGRRASIEDELAAAQGPLRSALLRELVVLDLLYRRRDGASPTPDEYRSRFPDAATAVAAAFDAASTGEEGGRGSSADRTSVDTTRPPGATPGGLPGVPSGAGARSRSATTAGSRFRVIRPHARGGLGEVFIARDEELNREVALKEVLLEYAHDPQVRARFVLEAEITGALEHPGVVPVYSLGTYADGRPFYAMRFVKGDSLTEMIRRFHADESLSSDPGRRSLELRKLLRRFLDVCNAIEYAHSKWILHRDLKPVNIIVGNYGETFVVDWGLAKATGKSEPGAEGLNLMPNSASGTAETYPGRAMGTPAYMSPEQARGDPSSLGTRSDVYSLGATLYHLLTGKPPFFGGDVDAILQRVQKGDSAPPRQVNPSIDKPLEAICLKAMATKPEDRYASVRALADDVERWLANERVEAYPEPWTRSLNRWLTRHRTSVTGAAAAGIVALMGLGIVSAVQTRARADLDRKNGELTQANARLNEANIALNIQRNRAEANETEAINAVKRFRDAVAGNRELKNNPALEGLRKTLLKEPLAFFRSLRERLLASRDTRPEALVWLANAAHDYAHLTDEIGDVRDGLKAHDDGQAIWELLARTDPSNPEYQRGLASILLCRGRFLRTTGHTTDALASMEAARTIHERLARDEPTVAQFQRDLAISHTSIGRLLSETGRPAEALASLEAARTVLERLARDEPTVARFQADLAESHNSIGRLLRDKGRPAEALTSLEAARTVLERLARDEPTVAQFQADLAASHHNISNILSKTGRPAEALASDEAARTILERLARDEPTVAQFQRDLAISHNSIGLLLRDKGEPAVALASHEAAREIQQKLAEDDPGSPGEASSLGGTLNNIALLNIDDLRFAEARNVLRDAIRWQKRALAANPRHPTYRQFLANHLKNLAIACKGMGRDDEAAEAQRELDELKANDPRFEAVDARLDAVQKGEASRNNAERLALASRAHDTRQYATAARLWAEALESEPTLAESRRSQHPYNAACAAALAASGQGADDPPPDEAARTRLRRQALTWLKEELVIWQKLLETGRPQAKALVAHTLAQWQQDADLAGVRDAGALEALPESERRLGRHLVGSRGLAGKSAWALVTAGYPWWLVDQ
jgi:serine/threonine-protein kinase